MILDRLFGFDRGERTTLMTGYGVQNDATLKAIFGRNAETVAGVDVDEASALTLSAVYMAVRLLAFTRAALPLPTYERKPNGDRELARAHPVYELLHTRPNVAMTSMVYREMETAYLLLWGDAISFIERNGGGEIIGLWPLHPAGIDIKRGSDGRLTYNISHVQDKPTSREILFDSDVLHVPNFPFNGLRGSSVVACARAQMGEALAAQTFGGAFFGNGARPGTIIKHPGVVKNPERLIKAWNAMHQGPSNYNKTAVLEEGATVEQIGMPLDDAQFLESRQFHVTEIARWFGLPPHKLNDLSHATFSNIAEQNIEFVQAVLPWLRRFEAEYNYKLFRATERATYYAEHKSEAMLEANPEQQAAYFSTALQNGWMNRNEVRRVKNLNGLGDGGEQYTVQVNLTTLDKLGEQPEPTTTEPTATPAETDPAAEASKQPIRVAESLVLNGAQITAATAIVTAVAAGTMPEDAGLGQLQILFNLTPEQAKQIMGTAGSFEAATPEPKPAFGEPDDNEEEPEDEEEQDEEPAQRTLRATAETLLRDSWGKVLTLAADEFGRASKAPGEFLARIDKYFAGRPAKLAAELRSAGLVCAAAGLPFDADKEAAMFCQVGREALLDLAGRATADVLPERVAAEMEAWRTIRETAITTLLGE